MKQIGLLPKSQKGTALTWVVSLFFIFMMGALVVDGSRLYHDKRKLQTVANRLATELANEVQACGDVAGSIDLGFEAKKAISGMNNLPFTADEINVEYAELVSIDSQKLEGVRAYKVNRIEDIYRSNGVSVSISKSVDGLIGFAMDKPLTAEASIRKELIAGVRIDSGIATLDPSSSQLLGLVFGEILGTDFSLNVTGLNDLAGVVTDIGGLVKDLGVSSVLDTLDVATVLEAVLNSTEGLTTPAISALDTLIDAAAGNNLSLEDVIQGVTEAEVPQGSEAPTLDLITSIILNVDHSLPSPIEIDLNEGLGIPVVSDLLSSLGLAKTKLELDITPAPGFILSSARKNKDGEWPSARSTNISARVLTEVGFGSALKLVELDVGIKAASALVTLTGAECVSGSDNIVDSIYMSGSADLLKLDADVKVLELGTFSILGISFDDPPKEWAGGIDIDFNNIDLGFYGGEENPSRKAEFDGTNEAIGSLVERLLDGLKVKLLGLDLTAILGPVVDPLSGVVGELLNGLLGPLLTALGVSLVPSELVLESVDQSYTLMEHGIDQ
ncbi:hypothetical protein MA04_01448 [Alcanivorax balearicus MACL04]|uniref:Putative Flp pilus-assembly TadG-like N-terminal domain-containing protein n=1 Tax=Alloalcanivorax balearicus MACL04 TaxID=1177182 RepID=A0ABT2QX96_9GAMM|nr:pilus assembly protein TadG-related protein [Alloalcanivorax balearicus]MCU5782148.1 hypothetical protein [Alloalcanivorax balearicus MACL04]